MPPPGQCCAVGAADEDVLRSKIRVDLATANRETQQFVQELISQQNIKMQKQIQALSDLVQEYITQVKQGGLSLAKKAPEEDVLRPMCSADFTMHGRMSMMPRLDFNDSHHLARMEKASNTNPFRTFKTQKKTLKTKDIAKMTTLQQWVHSKCFQILTVCAIFGNILAMGVEVDFDVSGALVTPAQPIPEAFAILNYIFLGIFGFEVIIKLAAFRGEFFRGDDHAWNLFDAFLVITQAAEILLESFSVGGMRAIRILRLVRTLRVIRLFHFFRELRMMVVCIFNSLMSLIWAVTLLITVTYVFAILCAQGAATWLREPSPADPTIVVISAGAVVETLRLSAGVHAMQLRTMLSLMMSVTGLGPQGVVAIGDLTAWGCMFHILQIRYQIAKPLMNMSYFYFAAFLFYAALAALVLLIVLCIMNVLSALFVEMALQIKDRDLLIQAELAKIDAFLKDMRDLFDEVDVDGNGYVTRIELSQYMKNERVMAYFGGQGLDMSDVGLMFDLLDSSHDGLLACKLRHR
ncbi:Sodium channel protein type 11 subunit alpha (NaN) (Sensory neuron sodium channel 2) (Sodium channel protein type XI subunit alpha) (Voltage-gated sodium channel subunit alpha Nav1.9) [Durusdinium trenchii]|uniref:Sodium channel protein type 11 subunit alpha (NaN) (Sensory neuron sodium channel 2) (Sodium channel protein type XI subunit alpha) (Voltage-gated sodium channel subunit alpha Nav1.9) n=1 Tax=Durusdinium trenchii TaxID=1381693 RepID=A0ABP0IVX7_9DINO